MELPGWIDSEVIAHPMYWLLTAGAEIALFIGFKLQSQWGAGMTMPLYSQIITLAIMPIAAYFVVMKIKS